MFHFPTFPPHALCVQARVTPHDWCGVPPFGHPRINARLAAPRGLSQPPTSFIGSWCPGIHRVPSTSWPHKNPTHTPHQPRPKTHPADHMGGTPTNKLCKTEIKRCSRPLCSSQRPTSDPPPRPRQTPATTRRCEIRKAPDEMNQTIPPPAQTGETTGPLPQDPTACLRPPDGTATLFHTTSRRRRPYWEPAGAGGRTGQRSTLEHHPGHPPGAPDGHRINDPGAAVDRQIHIRRPAAP